MLQQTTVQTVIPYYNQFLTTWPTVEDLAAADLDAVLLAWAGLGYYSRARNLHKCAKVLVSDLEGKFPDQENDLQKLPGIGPYTSAAIAAIAFGKPATPIDGNVERVMARLFAIEIPLPAAKKPIALHAGNLTPKKRSGDYAQAVMDLGATICTPRNPQCGSCPWRRNCKGFEQGIAKDLPIRAKKTPKPTRFGTVFWAEREDGAVLLDQRPLKGLLGGMWEFPSTPWETRTDPPSNDGDGPLEEDLRFAPVAGDWQLLSGGVLHTFTHFHLHLVVCMAEIKSSQSPLRGDFVEASKIGNFALPKVMKKVQAHVKHNRPKLKSQTK
jgi:A/G-specific adenine glycosylase